MPAVKTVADAKQRITLLTTIPTSLAGLTITVLNAGIDASCALAKNGTNFTATDSASVADAAVCESATAEALTESNYTAAVAPFWLLDSITGAYAALDNPVYEAIRVKNTRVVFVIRDGKAPGTAWASGDKYDAFEVLTDNPQRGDGAGYVKRIIPCKVQRAVLDGTVAT